VEAGAVTEDSGEDSAGKAGCCSWRC
jgi:hypothetical protein